MPDFSVSWELEVPNAADARDAAEYARSVQLDRSTRAGVFLVCDADGNQWRVDLDAGETSPL